MNPLTGVKDYIYAGAIAVLLACFLWYTVHERRIGEQKVAAEVQHTAMVAAAKDREIEAAAQAASSTIGDTYEKAVSIPAVGDIPGVLCHRSGSREVPSPASDSGRVNESPDSAAGPGYNPTGAALTIGRNADAQIAALQNEIRALVAEMQKANQR